MDFDGADFWDDHTRYEYWNDIEYDTDGYNDVQPKEKRKKKGIKSSEQVTQKGLKRRAIDSPVSSNKKRKTAAVASALQTLPPVLLVDKEAMEPRKAPTINVARLASYAILPDWRERISNNEEFSIFRSSNSLAVKPTHDIFMEDGEDLMEDEVDLDEEEVEISQDALKRALQQHLGSLGVADLGNIDENQLLKLMEQMISGEDVKDEMLDQLVDGLHDEAEEPQNANNISSWIASQVKTTEEDEEQISVPEETPTHYNSKRRTAADHSSVTAPTEEKPKPSAAPTRGTKRNAESPRSSPRKKSKTQLDKITARG